RMMGAKGRLALRVQAEQLDPLARDLDEDMLLAPQGLVLIGETELVRADLVFVDLGAKDLFIEGKRALRTRARDAVVAYAPDSHWVVLSHRPPPLAGWCVRC